MVETKWQRGLFSGERRENEHAKCPVPVRRRWPTCLRHSGIRRR